MTQSRLQSTFLSGVRSIIDAVRVARLIDAIRRGDNDAVLREVDIDDAALS